MPAFQFRRRYRGRVARGYTRRAGFYGRYRAGGGVGELKFHDLDIDDAVIATGGTIAQASCNIIIQGVTEAQRVGRKCTVHKIDWRMHMTLSQTATSTETSDTVRVILYLDKQTNGAAATVTGILESDDYQSFNNLANSSRFSILMDRRYDFSAPAGSGRGSTDTLSYGENTITDTFHKDCNIPIEYDSTTGAITEQRTNNIGVLLLSHGGFVQFLSKMRLRFSDN